MAVEDVLWASHHDWFLDSFEEDGYHCVVTTCGCIFTNFENMKEWAGY